MSKAAVTDSDPGAKRNGHSRSGSLKSEMRPDRSIRAHIRAHALSMYSGGGAPTSRRPMSTYIGNGFIEPQNTCSSDEHVCEHVWTKSAPTPAALLHTCSFEHGVGTLSVFRPVAADPDEALATDYYGNPADD